MTRNYYRISDLGLTLPHFEFFSLYLDIFDQNCWTENCQAYVSALKRKIEAFDKTFKDLRCDMETEVLF